MQTTFFHYQPSGDYFRDGPDSDSEGATVKNLLQLQHLSDDSMSEEEEIEVPEIPEISMEERELGLVPQPGLVWTLTKYTPRQVGQFLILLLTEEKIIARAAARASISSSAAYKLYKQWQGNMRVLPGYVPASEVRPRGNNRKLTEQHSQFLESYVEQHPTCCIKDATAELCKEFEGLSISGSSVHRHLTEKLSFTLTRTRPQAEARNSEDTRELRRQFVERLVEQNIDYRRQCVFIDESGFLKTIVRPVAWSKKGTPATVTVATSQGANLSILGCISRHGIIALSQQVPERPQSKKRKVASGKRTNLPHGTTSSHFQLFVEHVAEVLNEHGLQNMYIVMDNASIHKTAGVIAAIEKHHHIPLFLPPYSPFLNPIEECWAKVKAEVRKNPLSSKDSLVERIEEAARTVSAKDCQGWIRHSQKYFASCLDMKHL